MAAFTVTEINRSVSRVSEKLVTRTGSRSVTFKLSTHAPFTPSIVRSFEQTFLAKLASVASLESALGKTDSEFTQGVEKQMIAMTHQNALDL